MRALDLIHKFAACNWYHKLRNQLVDGMNFQQSENDPCLFMKDDMLVVVYVDDCLIFAKNGKDVNDFIAAMRDAKFKMTDEDTVDNFLGIFIEEVEDGYILNQPGLISRIMQECGIEEESKLHDTPEKSRKNCQKMLFKSKAVTPPHET